MLKIFKKILFWGLIFLHLGCHSQEQPPEAPPNYDGPDQEGWNSRITVTSNGRTSAIIQYAHMEKFSKRRETKFDDGIVVDFYNTAGQHTSNLVAERGVLYEENSDVEAIGKVVVKSDSGMTVWTPRLRWENARQKIISNDLVTIATAEHDTLHGQGFVSDQNLKVWSIRRPSGVSQKKIDLTGAGQGRAPAPDSLDIK